MSGYVSLPKRLLVGRPLSSEQMGETLLPKWLALPVFCSDPLSSNAYATEEILLVLSVGGLALLHLTPWVAAAVVVLLVTVVVSYRQTCHAYPSGGGAYAVSRANLGQRAALVAAAALLIDYVLTVAVSIAAGVSNLVSAFPGLSPYAVEISIGLVAVLTLANLRGVKESGRAFAVPTYGFVVAVFSMLAIGVARTLTGHAPVAESAAFTIDPGTDALVGLALAAVVLRSFASGCTALTGVEAVSNGVPSFRRPKAGNAAATLAIMAGLTVTMFVGLTFLALASGVHVAEDVSHLVGAPEGYTQRTVIAQVAGAVFGLNTPGFYAVQVFTTLVLVLAANTAYNGFPILASILGQDGFLPRQLSRRGDRLVFSNGIIILSAAAAGLLAAFDASPTRLIQLYILGVFVSFTLSQAGMVRHWTRALREDPDTPRHALHRARAINGFGAVLTTVVLVIVLVSKFSHGAYLVVLAMPVLYLTMRLISRHYARVDAEVTPTPDGVPLPSRVHAVVLVSRLTTPALRALSYARASRPSTLTALTIRTSPEATQRLVDEWEARGVPVPLTLVDSPFRDITRPAVDYIAEFRRQGPRDVVAVYIPEYVVEHWWEQLLHNQSALRLKARLLFQPGVMVISVPWRFGHDAPPTAPARAATSAGGPRVTGLPRRTTARRGVEGADDTVTTVGVRR
ncbi:APC family permease [Actinotalea sp.]|uniref:APC family permease n=1 Tax=Actinotalea sp. TaxID=1872145 RepID=UPI002C54E185|nr:APC family permease [Actinotalea sp.]HQY32604.1 APC family permease [Actinotalea sp.]HRA50145.1 APC family permease [Actinotalea sp.]